MTATDVAVAARVVVALVLLASGVGKLAALPRNGSAVRIHNRCEVTGRPRGTFRQFGLGRAKIREMAFEGNIPGVTKASW